MIFLSLASMLVLILRALNRFPQSPFTPGRFYYIFFTTFFTTLFKVCFLIFIYFYCCVFLLLSVHWRHIFADNLVCCVIVQQCISSFENIPFSLTAS